MSNIPTVFLAGMQKEASYFICLPWWCCLMLSRIKCLDKHIFTPDKILSFCFIALIFDRKHGVSFPWDSHQQPFEMYFWSVFDLLQNRNYFWWGFIAYSKNVWWHFYQSCSNSFRSKFPFFLFLVLCLLHVPDFLFLFVLFFCVF